LDAISTKRSMLVEPTKRKYQKDVLQMLDHKRIKECHRRSGKENNGRCFFEKQLEKIYVSPNGNKSSHTEKFYLRNEIISDTSSNTPKIQSLQRFSKLNRKVILEKTSKTEGSLVAKECPKGFSFSILAKNNFKYSHCQTPYSHFHSSALVEATRVTPTKNSSKNSRKTLNRQHKFEAPRRNLRSNSSQISKENKSRQTKDSKSLVDGSLLSLKRSRKSVLQSICVPYITRERFAARKHGQPIQQCSVRKLTSIKQMKTLLGTK